MSGKARKILEKSGTLSVEKCMKPASLPKQIKHTYYRVAQNWFYQILLSKINKPFPSNFILNYQNYI